MAPSIHLLDSSPTRNSESRTERMARALPIGDRARMVKTIIRQVARPLDGSPPTHNAAENQEPRMVWLSAANLHYSAYCAQAFAPPFPGSGQALEKVATITT